jgi:adenylate cyclase
VGSIRVAGRSEAITVNAARSLLVTLQATGVPIHTLCGGRARCGRCAVRVLSGGERLSPPRERELERLRAMGAAPEVRLACQTYARADLVLEVVNPGPEAQILA